MKYSQIEKFPDEQFRRLTGVKISTLDFFQNLLCLEKSLVALTSCDRQLKKI